MERVREIDDRRAEVRVTLAEPDAERPRPAAEIQDATMVAQIDAIGDEFARLPAPPGQCHQEVGGRGPIALVEIRLTAMPGADRRLEVRPIAPCGIFDLGPIPEARAANQVFRGESRIRVMFVVVSEYTQRDECIQEDA